MDNLNLWQTVQQTDPKFTKEFKRGGGFNGTAVNPTWLVKRATETFGPIGIGWGYTIQDEAYQKGHAVLSDDGHVTGEIVIHKIRLEVWYIWNGQLGRVQQFGQTEFVGRNKFGWFTDEEAPKKSLTDALGKCLSLIGFAADVHMGMFDDSKYVNSLKDSGTPPPAAKGTPAPKGASPELVKSDGNLKITELKERVKELGRNVSACSDSDELIGLLSTAQAIETMTLAEQHLPSWWFGVEGENNGLKNLIESTRAGFATQIAAE